MKISDFIEKFKINPSKDIDPHFDLIKKIETSNHDESCYNCGDTRNNEYLKSIPWTAVKYCWKCKALSVVFFQDRMSGVSKDVVNVYIERASPSGVSSIDNQ